jgi:hypothetical protein
MTFQLRKSSVRVAAGVDFSERFYVDLNGVSPWKRAFFDHVFCDFVEFFRILEVDSRIGTFAVQRVLTFAQ